jgi:hypothetical protein
MKEKKPAAPKLSLVQALTWIVGSTLVVSGTASMGMKWWRHWKKDRQQDPKHNVVAIIQTGPQKEALKTVYLAEIMGISANRPVNLYRFNSKLAEKKLCDSPVIKEAQVKTMKPGAVHVDYTVRQPIAWIYDFENTAIDEEGVLFPVYPFFSPKKLPEIYLGLPPFGFQSEDPDRQAASWRIPRNDKYTLLALELIKLLKDSSDLLNVRRIDVSNAFAESYGTREIVLMTEDAIVLRENNRQTSFLFPRILRLSTKNFSQELGNYLKLREELLQKERMGLSLPKEEISEVRMPEKIIDFRIPRLAFIDQPNTGH